MKRPVGVTIIAILTIVSGILGTLGGLSLMAFGALFSTVPLDTNTPDQQQLLQQQQIQDAAQLQALNQFAGSVGLVLGAIILAVGIGFLVVSYGLLKGRGWAWTITVIITIIAVVIQVVSTIMFSASFLPTSSMDSFVYGVVYQIIGFAISGVILYYLYRPNVKTYFGNFRPSTAIQR